LMLIAYQDIKDREVYAFIFPVLAIGLGMLHYFNVYPVQFFMATGINLIVVLMILGILYVYTRLRIKKPFFKEVFGLGDALFFVALALGFPTVTFVVILVFSLLFSLLTWIVFKRSVVHSTIPLAGYMSIFLGVLFFMNYTVTSLKLYVL